MEHLGTEIYKSRDYGKQEASYYLDGSIVEERVLTGDKKSFAVTRYLRLSPANLEAVKLAIKEADGVEAKTSHNHDALKRLLFTSPSIDGYIDVAEIDKSDRKVLISGSMNLPSGAERNAQHVFVHGLG